METFEFIFETAIGVTSVIAMLICGIFIGKFFGSFKKFIQAILNEIELRIKN